MNLRHFVQVATVNVFFLRKQHVCSLILSNIRHKFSQVKCTQYWPERNKPFSAGPVVVKLIEEKEYAFYMERKMSVSNKEV